MARFVVLLLVGLGAAGCVQGGEPNASPPSQAASAAPASPDEISGSVVGTVVDDEGRPIEGVDVIDVQNASRATRTDREGAFTINEVPPGSHTLVFRRLGWSEAARAVNVVAGQVTEVTIVLATLAVGEEPYRASVSKTAYIVFGNAALTTIWYQGVNHSTYNQLVCDPCRFTLFTDMKPAGILSETIWAPGAANAVNQEIFLNYLQKGTDAEYGQPYWLYYTYFKNRASVHWPEGEVKKITAPDQMRLWVRPDLDGLSVDHRPTIWTTFGYHGELAPEFTALPPA